MIRLIVFACLVATCLGGVDRQINSNLARLPAPSIPIRGRIVGGEETTIDQVPWQVVFLLFNSFRCGGSIIRPDVILSAAHCLFFDSITPSFYTFRAGSSYFATGGQVIGTTEVIPHPSYIGDDYDIVIFKLVSSFTLGTDVNVIALPEQNQIVSDGEIALISGWGALTEDGLQPSVLQKVEIPIVNQQACNDSYATIGFYITDVEFCAGEFGVGGKDACSGDSGGPLVINNQLIGVTSWGEGCARAEFPGVWTRVPSFVDWIYSEL